MGTSAGSFYSKQIAVMTPEAYANNGNVIFNAIKNAGMIQVPHETISGQCDSLVTIATENPYDLVVTLSYLSFNSAQGLSIKGFKVFRHPTLNFYLKVDICEVGSNSQTRTAMVVRYTIALDIDSSGALLKTNTIYGRMWGSQGFDSNHNIFTKAGYGYAPGQASQFKVSVGHNHFCLGTTHDLASYEYYYIHASTSGVSAIPCALGYSTAAIAIFKPEDSTDLNVLSPRTLVGSTSYPNEVGLSTDYGSYGLPRQWRIDATTGVAESSAHLFFSNLQPTVISDVSGVRVAQVMTTKDGVLNPLPIATTHAGAVDDLDILTIDIDGNGDRQYFACYGFGASTWIHPRTPVAKYPIYLLPWGD